MKWDLVFLKDTKVNKELKADNLNYHILVFLISYQYNSRTGMEVRFTVNVLCVYKANFTYLQHMNNFQ